MSPRSKGLKKDKKIRKFKERKDDERLRQIFRISGIGIFDHDHLSDSFHFSEELRAIFGWDTQEKATLEKMMDQIHPSDRKRVAAAVKRAEDPSGDGKLELDHRILIDKRVVRWITRRSQTSFKEKRGTRFPARTVGAFLDVTERKRMEEELLKIQKLESLEVMAGGIAHDFNNVLTGIMGNLSLALSWGSLNDETLTRLKSAEKASLRAKELANQLLSFSKGDPPSKKPTSMREMLENSVRFALTGTRIVTRFSIDKNLWTVEIDDGQIHQVIQNLVINALQAMPQGGTLQVSGKNIQVMKDRDETKALKEGKYVRISFKDSGIGIKKSHLSKIFDPYFTTKLKGSGLGLWISYSVIRRHTGLITVESSPGKGTTFHIYLPASTKKPLAKKEIEELKKGKGRILVIDDEESVLDVAGEMIRNLKYSADRAITGTEGLQKYVEAREGGEPFDLVMTDLTLPGGLSGLEILKQLKGLNPNVKVIVSSGYSNDPVIEGFQQFGFDGYIAKPYRIYELSRTLDLVLNSELPNPLI
ncbi:MAG: response regulator [Nitrospirae bacterium]|nr:response regulator [Nitrospirota bacterium]